MGTKPVSCKVFLSTTKLMVPTSLVCQLRAALQLSTVNVDFENSVSKSENAISILGTPNPTLSVGVRNLLPLRRIAFMICILLNSGKPCQRQVPSPANFGQA